MTPVRTELTHILDVIEDGMLTVDAGLCITWMNRPCERILGKVDLLPDVLAASVRAGQSRFDYVQPSGDCCYAVRVYPSVGATVLVFSEVTEQRRAEEAARVREEQLRTLLAHTPDIVSRFDRDLRFTYINPAVEALTGQPAGLWIGKSHEEAGLPAGVSDKLRASLRRIFETAQRDDVEFEVATPNGIRALYGIGVPEFGQDGEVTSALSIVRDITALRSAQSQSESETQRLELAVRAHGIGSYDWNIQTGDVAWTEQQERLFGLKPGTFEGNLDGWRSRVHPDDADRIQSSLKSCIDRRGEFLDLCFRIRRHDGVVRTLEGSGRFIYAPDGTPLRMVGVNYDITERVRTEAALRESHKQLRMIQSMGGVGLWDWDVTDDSVSWSDEIYGIVGTTRKSDRFPASVWRGCVHSDDSARLEKAAASTLASGGLFDTEYRLLRADGEIRWVISRGTIRRDANGQPAGITGLMLDITDRKRVVEALERSEERQRLAADAGKIGLWDWDIENDRIVWSDRIYELHGLEPGSFGGRVQDFASLVHPEDAGFVQAALQHALQTGEAYDVEFRTVWPDRQIRWLATRARVVFGSNGKPARLVGAVYDTTERRHAEEQLRAINRELEEFAFVASHDLQEPLRTVKATSQLLVRKFGDVQDADARQLSAFISSAVGKMENLIRDLLAYSRTVHYEHNSGQTADLNAAFETAEAAVKTAVLEAGAHIEAARLPLVAGETVQFAHVFQNLFSNSVKYARAGVPPRISVTAERHACEWIVAVRDNGIGFEQRFAERIFGLFRRLHRDEYPGSGLGLAICKRVVERYGGRIWAESSPGEGSVFYFALPALNE